jgi:hypothetical protein
MSVHTPGPWEVYYRAGGVGWPGGIVTTSPLYDHERPELVPGEMWNRCLLVKFHINDFDRLAYVNSDKSVSFATLTEHNANALLIAAAPELLEALKAVHSRRIVWPKEIEQMVVSAIAKAEGK